MRLHGAYIQGARAAVAKFAGTLGASIGVQPTGPVVSHGTMATRYPPRAAPEPAVHSSQAASAAASLWDSFTSNDRLAPGRADGTFSDAVIG